MKKPLNILHMSSTRKRGGSGASAMAIVKKLHERGHKVIYVCRESSLGFNMLKEKNLKMITTVGMKAGFKPTPSFISTFLNDIKTIAEIIDEEKINIVHMHSSPEGWIGTVAALRSSMDPALIRTRHIVVPVKRNQANIYMFNNYTDAVITVAETIRQHYFDRGLYDLSKIETIYDGVDISRFNPRLYGSTVRNELGIKEGTSVISVIARYSRVKGHIYFLEAMKEVVKDFPQTVALLAGQKGKKGNLGVFEELCSATERLGLKDNVRFLDFRTDIPEILAASDIFVLPSIGSEGSSRGTLEAMAMAKPCVVTKVGVLPEFIEEGITGCLVNKKDGAALAQGIKKLLSRMAEAKKMGERARTKVLERYSEDIMVEKTEDLYYRAIEKKRKRSSAKQ